MALSRVPAEAAAARSQRSPSPQIGFAAPDFTLKTLDGQMITLSDLWGQPFTRYGLRNTLSKLGKKVGIEGVTTHAFRRSFACIADDAGASTRKIQLWGRWSDIRMVERYTLALKAGKQYNQYSPIDYLEAKRQNGKDSTE